MEEAAVLKLVDKKLEDVTDNVNKKLDSKIFWMIVLPVIAAGASAILSLYVNYYSGLTDIKVDLATTKSDVSNIKEQVGSIQRTLSEAQITK